LNFSKQISSLKSQDGLFYPNLVYGVSTNLSHPEFMKSWLAIIGYIMSCVLIVMHAVFIGNDLMYKMDNVIILAQTIYYFSFVRLLVGRLLAQFYYGWIFSHAGFFPNYFSATIPSDYRELAAPNSYKLATNDSNVIRNAGFSMSLLITFILAFIVIA
jgi:hypothetical protein